jgi:hypothetical protein
MPAIKKLNLNPVAGMSGEHKLETGDIPQSPRARMDSVLETPRTAMGRKEAVTGQYGSVRAQAKRSSAQSAPRHARRLCDAPTPTRAFPRTRLPQAAELHGEGPVAIASTGDLHASIGVNGKLAIWQAKGVKEGDELQPLCQVILQLPPDIEAKVCDDGLGWPRMASDGLGVPPPAIACACLPPQAKKMDKDGKMKMLSEKPPKWMGFDCSGKHLGVHRPGVGFWLCQVHADGQVRWLAL